MATLIGENGNDGGGDGGIAGGGTRAASCIGDTTRGALTASTTTPSSSVSSRAEAAARTSAAAVAAAMEGMAMTAIPVEACGTVVGCGDSAVVALAVSIQPAAARWHRGADDQLERSQNTDEASAHVGAVMDD